MGQSTEPKEMTLADVLKLKAIEKAAKDAFFAEHLTASAAGKPGPNYRQLQAAMIAATKARQAAMAAYCATL